MRRLTVGHMARARLRPLIRIQGEWLLALGWEVGDKVEVFEDRKEIVLRRIHIEDSHSRQMRLPHVEATRQEAIPGQH